MTRLNLDDVFGGSKPAPITDPVKQAEVVTGLFRQILRADPTEAELQNYLGLYKRAGVNGVVAGLYSSTAFRQTEVNNNYLEMFGRPGTYSELKSGTTKLVLGMQEQTLVASIAGSNEFYELSSANGGPNGVNPSATTFVNLLYRSLLGQAASSDPKSAAYIRRAAVLPISWMAAQFVNDPQFRTVKVGEIYTVAGITPTDAQVAQDVRNWVWKGGLAGIATTLLASAENISNIEANGVRLPDMEAVRTLTELLLTPYTSDILGFTKLLETALHTDPVDGTTCAGEAPCNPGLLDLIQNGGASRGIPNRSIVLTDLFVAANAPSVRQLIPTQNEIDIEKSLKFPLTDPKTTATYFAGGVITPPGGTGGSAATALWTANGGRYIIDGHHRWSAIFLINPDAQIVATDFNYVQDPQTALKETQFAIAAAFPTFDSSTAVPANNIFTMPEPVFNQKVEELILSGPDQEAVIKVFVDNLGLDPAATEEAHITSIQNYLWGNVELMRANNQPVTGATNRSVMPQAQKPLEAEFAYLRGGTLSYSFPVISYLG